MFEFHKTIVYVIGRVLSENCIIWYFVMYVFKISFFSTIRVQEGPLHISRDIILFKYNLKNPSSAFCDPCCLSVDLSHWYDNGDWYWNGRSNQNCFLQNFLPRKGFLLLFLHSFALGTRLRFGKLKNFIGNMIVFPNMKNYLGGCIFFGRFYVVFHIVHFSIVGAFTFVFLLDTVFSLSLLESELLSIR